MKKIIWKYKDSDNVIIRTPISGSIEDIVKTLPKDTKYKIIDNSDFDKTDKQDVKLVSKTKILIDYLKNEK